MYKFTIIGQTPSSKNTPQVFIKGGKVIHIPNKLYIKWKNDAIKQLIQQKNEIKDFKIEYPVEVLLWFTRNSKRRWDYNNVSQAVMDVLVASGIIIDDDVYHCKPVFDGFFVNPDYPKVDIIIKEVK